MTAIPPPERILPRRTDRGDRSPALYVRWTGDYQPVLTAVLHEADRQDIPGPEMVRRLCARALGLPAGFTHPWLEAFALTNGCSDQQQALRALLDYLAARYPDPPELPILLRR